MDERGERGLPDPEVLEVDRLGEPLEQPLAAAEDHEPGPSSGPVMYPSTDVVIPATILLITASLESSPLRRPGRAELIAPAALHQLVVHDGTTAEQRAAA